MNIALISTYISACPPLMYGGESYYWGIAKTLGEMAHKVYLFGTGGSQIPPNGRLFYIKSSPMGQIDYRNETWIERIYHDIFMNVDIIHDCSLDHIPAERLKYLYGKNNIINTINGRTYYMPRPPFNVVTGSRYWQAEAKSAGLNTEMVYWGIDIDFYHPLNINNCERCGGYGRIQDDTQQPGVYITCRLCNGIGKKIYEKEDYFLWISRFHPVKGLDLALDLAEYMGFHLKVAGSMEWPDHRQYGVPYLERIKNIPNVEFIELPKTSKHHEAKRELYQKARAFLYPVQYPESFGMVVIEAMACGCPVIATKIGAMPELITEKSGFLCENKQDFVRAINFVDTINPEDCRKQAEKFSWKASTEGYLKLYDKVLNGESW